MRMSGMATKRAIRLLRAALLGAAFAGQHAAAVEYRIGSPQNISGMEVAAVYLQPIEMEPEGMMRKAADSDLHLEADIRTLASNPNGFAEGAWIPHLVVKYQIVKLGSGERIAGELMPMVASDGPHYGDNVKMAGPGKYKLKLLVAPPIPNHFGRHTDRATGVRPWFRAFEVEWEFTFVGVGKKGGY